MEPNINKAFLWYCVTRAQDLVVNKKKINSLVFAEVCFNWKNIKIGFSTPALYNTL